MISALWDKLDPGFLAPVWLLVGFVAVIALALLELGAYRRRAQAVRMFAASHLVASLTANVSPIKRLIKSIMLAAGMGLLFVALARPYLFYDWQDEDRSGLDLLIAVDCSKSMLTQDVRPSRLERAKLAISDFADRLPDNRLGLIAFAGDAFLECPLTLDHDAFQTAVRDLDTDTIPRPGTDIAAAIDQAVDALRSQPNNLKFLILVTDGEDLEGRAVEAARNAAQSGLKIYTIGVGTPHGDLVPDQEINGTVTQYHADSSGQRVISKLDEDTLQQIAAATGGAYLELGQRGEGLDEIYNRYIAPLPKQNLEEKREKIHIERFVWPLTLATLFLMAEFMITERAGGRNRTGTPETPSIPSRRPPRRKPVATVPATTTLIALLFFLILPVRAADVTAAERDYKAGKFEESMENYQKAAENSPTRSDLQYDHGDAAYKAGEFSEAEEAYRRALETPDLNLQEKTYYNLGNAQYQHGEAMQKVDSKKTISLWEEALHSYDSALKLKTTDDARHNYDFVKTRLEQLKKQMQQQGKNKSGSSQNGDQSGEGDDGQQGQSGDYSAQDPSQGDQGQKQNGGKSGQKDGGSPKDATNMRTYSGKRPQDQKDPNIRSRQDAENLLDSLKDDQRRVTARALNQLNGNNPPPPPSGKDW